MFTYFHDQLNYLSSSSIFHLILLNLLQPGDSINIEELQQALQCVSCQQGHPLLIQQQGRDSTFSVYCDTHLIPCGTTFTEAFDFFFKLFWVFQLEYTCGLTNFFKFVEHKIFKLCEKGVRVPPTVNEAARLLNL